MPKSDLNEVYAEQLRNHPEGHALYFKVPGSSMKPGSCGYFTESGHWRAIVHVADVEPKSLEDEGWKPPARLITTESQVGIEWPIKLSESVQERKIKANLKTNVPNAPLSGGFTMSFGTRRGAGAVLITAGEVKCSQLTRDLEAYNWVTEPQNMRKLLDDWEEISKQKRTLWMITGNYTAKSCALSALRSPELSATVGVQANVADVLQASPTLQWWEQATDKTWIKYQDNSGVVLFMSGIALRTGFFRRSELFAEHKRLEQDLTRDASASGLQYAMDEEQDPLTAVVVPEYVGRRSEELEAELESKFSAESQGVTTLMHNNYVEWVCDEKRRKRHHRKQRSTLSRERANFGDINDHAPSQNTCTHSSPSPNPHHPRTCRNMSEKLSVDSNKFYLTQQPRR